MRHVRRNARARQPDLLLDPLVERSPRITERSLLTGQRPLLVVARRRPRARRSLRPPMFPDENDVMYLAIPLRNAGTCIAHVQGQRLDPEPADRVQADPLGPARHRRGGR